MLVLIMAQLQLTDVHIDMKVLREEHGEKRKRNGPGGGGRQLRTATSTSRISFEYFNTLYDNMQLARKLNISMCYFGLVFWG